VDTNLYALEMLAKTRLEQLRADAARHSGLASCSNGGTGLRAALRSALRYATMTCSLVRMEGIAPAERKVTPSARTRA
jgi:hypothetical protein